MTFLALFVILLMAGAASLPVLVILQIRRNERTRQETQRIRRETSHIEHETLAMMRRRR